MTISFATNVWCIMTCIARANQVGVCVFCFFLQPQSSSVEIVVKWSMVKVHGIDGFLYSKTNMVTVPSTFSLVLLTTSGLAPLEVGTSHCWILDGILTRWLPRLPLGSHIRTPINPAKSWCVFLFQFKSCLCQFPWDQWYIYQHIP